MSATSWPANSRRRTKGSGDRQQRGVSDVLVGHVQENRRRRIVTDEGNDVDDALMPEQLNVAGERLRIDLVLADTITSQLDDDPLLFSQPALAPAQFHLVHDPLPPARLPSACVL